jgi:hypothetical protein
MAKKRKRRSSSTQRSRKAYWLWPFWPLVPVSSKQLAAAKKLAEARGQFWSESFNAVGEAIGKLSEEWSKASRQSSR